MHLSILLTELTQLFGEPVMHADGHTTYRWSIARTPASPGLAAQLAIHLLMNVNEMRESAIVWIFDPLKTPVELRLNGHRDLPAVLDTIRQSVTPPGQDVEAAWRSGTS